jgi:hypothetical protein
MQTALHHATRAFPLLVGINEGQDGANTIPKFVMSFWKDGIDKRSRRYYLRCL